MRPKQEMSDRSRAVLAFILQYRAEHRYSPTIREIGAAIGVPSTSLISYYLDQLVDGGYLVRDPKVSRSIVLTRKGIVWQQNRQQEGGQQI